MRDNPPRRIVTSAFFGIACYELESIDGDFASYIHKGVVGTKVDARRWLSGEKPKKLIKVYPEKGE